MVDKKTNYLYWGEVGPDANNDSFQTRGPRGYDEVNQARNAGFFGWPLFVGNNYPYHDYEYATGTTQPIFDTAAPVNDSRNNTGLQTLPKVSPALYGILMQPRPIFRRWAQVAAMQWPGLFIIPICTRQKQDCRITTIRNYLFTNGSAAG